jgi:hypothetical protein
MPSMSEDLSASFRTTAAQPRLTGRGPLARRLEPILLQQARYLAAQLRPWEQDPRAMLLTDVRSNEHGIRPNSHTAYGLAMLSRVLPDEAFAAGFTRNDARQGAIAILRFVLPTHGAGGRRCADDKPWHSQWQSALWAFSAGKAAWLLWDELEPQLRRLAAHMIADEANRFVNEPPPCSVTPRTRTDSNIWNSQILSLACCMFPDHPDREKWRENAIRWILNAFATSRDLEDGTIYDGRPLREWLVGANIHDDYTLENHNRVHPDYMSAIHLGFHQRQIYQWAAMPAPQALAFNVQKIYGSLKKMMFPDGGYVYPNGQDWAIHRLAEWLDTHAGMAVVFEDPAAALMMRRSLEASERMASRNRDAGGGIYAEHEYFFPSLQQSILEWHATAYHLLRTEGEGVEPVDEPRLWEELSGRHLFNAGRFVLVRTPRSVSSFSWGAQVMGMALPLQRDLLLTPNERSLIGIIEVEGIEKERPIARDVQIHQQSGGIAITGIIDRAEGAVEQRFAFMALDDGRSLYADAVRRVRPDAVMTRLDMATIGVLNETVWIYHNGRRRLLHAGGALEFLASNAQADDPVILSSPWFNIDDKLGILCLRATGEAVYDPRPSPARGRLEQLFHLNRIDPARLPADGSPLAGSVIILHPAQPHEQTRAVAMRARLHEQAEPDIFTVVLEDGKSIGVDLNRLRMTTAAQ